MILVSAALGMSGCGPATTSQQLVGDWLGRPDTLAAKRDRNPIPTAQGYQSPEPDSNAKTVSKTETEAKLDRLQPSHQTDLEAFDFTVGMSFHADGTVQMRLDGQQEITGLWKILSTDVGVSIIELTDRVPPEDADDEAPPEATELTKRRFSLQFTDNGDGFTLREEGVDPRFGWLYFKRAE